MQNLPDNLQALVEQAKLAQPSREVALAAFRSLDLTSLNDNDTPETIATVVAKADQGELGHTAAVCVYPKFVSQAFNAVASKGINVATVINFPSGKGTPEQTYQDAKNAIAAGATEIDIVLDYSAFLADPDLDGPQAILDSCRQACDEGGAKMKVILETSEFEDAGDLDAAADMAILSSTDFIKTSTGKDAKGGATLEAAAIMLDAIKDIRDNGGPACGLKISGGVKTVTDAAQYIALAESIMGKDWVTPGNFRIGASSVLNDILKTLGKDAKAPSPNPGGY